MPKLKSNTYFEGKVYVKGDEMPKGYKGKNVTKEKKAKKEDNK